MKSIKQLFLTAMLCAILPSLAFAVPVFNGTIYRNVNSVSSTIDLIGFDVFSTSNVTINLQSWEKSPLSRINYDINGDGEIAYLDTAIMLFNDDGALDGSDLIAQNDDGPKFKISDPLNSDYLASRVDGSLTYDDAYLRLDLNPGSYILGVGAWDMTLDEVLAGINYGDDADGTYIPIWGGTKWRTNYFENDHGDYKLSFCSGNVGNVHLIPPGNAPVPEPATMALMGIGLLGMAGLRKKIARN